MPRRKLSEYRSKIILSNALGLPYVGWENDIKSAQGYSKYVVKVDQAVKGRFKKGLVMLDVAQSGLSAAMKKLQVNGYQSFIIEPYVKHDGKDERYLCMTRDGQGLHLRISNQGGVDIESQTDSIESFIIDSKTNWSSIAKKSGFTQDQLQTLVQVFQENYFTLLEINPYVAGSSLTLLDAAIEVDDAATLLVQDWSTDDLRTPPRHLSEEEQTVTHLNETSPASFMLQVINPDGAAFLLLSGGGASVVVADEIYSAGHGHVLANYGEYSGNPTLEETYVYASAVFRLLLASKAPSKIVFIGGAVANFTNIEKTFGGIIRAIDEYAGDLKKQGVKIFVRRGGPHQEAGLRNMRETLQKYDLLGAVNDQRTPIGEAVKQALKGVKV